MVGIHSIQFPDLILVSVVAVVYFDKGGIGFAKQTAKRPSTHTMNSVAICPSGELGWTPNRQQNSTPTKYIRVVFKISIYFLLYVVILGVKLVVFGSHRAVENGVCHNAS